MATLETTPTEKWMPAKGKEISIQRTARIAGALILLMAVIAPFSLLYIPSTLIVPGDAATTANNLMASQMLFRLGIADDLIILLLEIVITVLLYTIVRPVSKTLALVAGASRLVMTVIQGVNVLNHFLALLLVSGAGYLTVFEPGQLQALAMLFLNAHQSVVQIWGVAFGLHLFVLGYLIYKSGYIPKFVGILLVVGAFCYFIQSFGNILLPSYEAAFAKIGFLSIVEIALPLWLLVKGVNAGEWKKRSLESA